MPYKGVNWVAEKEWWEATLPYGEKTFRIKNHRTDKEAAKALDGLCLLSAFSSSQPSWRPRTHFSCCNTGRLLYKLYQEDGFKFVHPVLQVGLSDQERAELDCTTVAALELKLQRKDALLVSLSTEMRT